MPADLDRLAGEIVAHDGKAATFINEARKEIFAITDAEPAEAHIGEHRTFDVTRNEQGRPVLTALTTVLIAGKALKRT